MNPGCRLPVAADVAPPGGPPVRARPARQSARPPPRLAAEERSSEAHLLLRARRTRKAAFRGLATWFFSKIDLFINISRSCQVFFCCSFSSMRELSTASRISV